MRRILCINAGGKGDLHELRMHRLTASLSGETVHFSRDRSEPMRDAISRIGRLVRSENWDLVYLESTGMAAGIPLIWAARSCGARYIVSSGDPVSGYFAVTRGPLAGSAARIYERMLYKNSVGFIGWTPYLTGRAIHMGAPTGATIEGAVDLDLFAPCPGAEKRAIRESLEIPPENIVCGVVGSLRWSARQSYCYGLELVKMLPMLSRDDVSVLIVGDGDGRRRLEQMVPDALRPRVRFTGRVPEGEVARYMNAMDIGFITQTLDQLGSYRLTTKLPEYLACGLPVAMSPVPGFFDYLGGAGWALPARHPASVEFHQQCAAWLDALQTDDIALCSSRARFIAAQRFSYDVLEKRFRTFVAHATGCQ